MAWTSPSTANALTTADRALKLSTEREPLGAPVFVLGFGSGRIRPGASEAAAFYPPAGNHGFQAFGQALCLDIAGAVANDKTVFQVNIFKTGFVIKFRS